MNLCPEAAMIAVYNVTNGLPVKVVDVEIPFDRLYEEWHSTTLTIAYLSNRIPREDDGCGNKAARLIHHKAALEKVLVDAGQDRILPLLKMADFNTFFTIDIKWF